jgi:3-deoxy-7-phosphoheptulonate synthase
LHTTEDIRIQWTKVVLPPVFLEEEYPVTEAASATIYNARNEIVDILNGRDSRLLVLVGPCSIHDTKAAREYAALLQSAIQEFSADLRIVMRVYFEKPRTTIGWKGLINDPYLDQSYKINDGLRQARRLLLNLAEMGVPTGTEFLACGGLSDVAACSRLITLNDVHALARSPKSASNVLNDNFVIQCCYMQITP